MPRTLLLLLLFLQVNLAPGQSFIKNQSVVHYTDENGLPQNSIKSIARDKDGFLWLATESGLTRFDGHDFFTFDKNNSDLKSSRFYCLLPDLTNNPNRFYAIGDNLSDVMRVEKQHAVIDPAYNISQLGRIPYSNTEYDRIASGLPNNLLSISDPVLRYYIILVPNRTGNFYIVHRNKIEYFQGWKKRWQRPAPGMDFNRYFCIKGKLFFFDVKGSLLKLEQNTSEQIQITGEILADKAFIPSGIKNEIYWNHLSDQFFIKIGERLYYMNYTSGSIIQSELILNGFDFEDNTIRTIYYDAGMKTVLLGSTTNGLFVFKAKPFTTILSGNNPLDNIFYAQTVYGRNQILTPKGIILGNNDKADKDDGSVKAILPLVKSGFQVDGNSILRDNQGNIWSKSGFNLYQYDSKGVKLLNSWNMNDQIYTLYKGSSGRIWIGMNRTGLHYFDPGSLMSVPAAVKGGLIKDIIYIVEGSGESLWLATYKGVLKVDSKTGSAAHLNGTDSLSIRSIFKLQSLEGNGTPFLGSEALILTTSGDGMYVFVQGKLLKLPLDKNKFLNSAHYIEEDQNGYLWIPTNKGLFQFSKAELIGWIKKELQQKGNQAKPFFLYYTKENGFNSNEFNGGCQPCAVRLPNGQLSLPSMNGLVLFDPEKIALELPKNNLIIDRVEIGDKTELIQNDTLFLNQNPQRINFFISLPYFGNSYNVNISYNISSSEAKLSEIDWISLKTDDPIIRFSQLSSGNYVLRVRKKNGFGENNYYTRSIMIIVDRQWYETIWFRAIGFILFASLIYWIIRLRTQFLKNKNDDLEIKILARTQSLADALVKLQASEKQLSRQMQMWTKLVASISHDVKTPMIFLAMAAEKIEPMISSHQHQQASLLGSTIAASAKQIKQLLENMIDYIRTQYKGERIQFTEVLLAPMIVEKIKLFTPAITAQGNQIKNEIILGTSVFSNTHLLAIVLHNILDNANKFTSNGHIRIYTMQLNGSLHLNIDDSGPGLTADVIAWLNDTDSEHKSEDELRVSQQVNGIGLLMVKEIATMLGIQIQVRNEKGTRFELIFHLE